MGAKRLTGAETALEQAVQDKCNSYADDYESGVEGFLDDLMQGGCQSGMVGSLVYYTDTVAFYEEHRTDIGDLLAGTVANTGMQPPELFGDKWDADDPLTNHTLNQNLMAWFAFEETARNLADQNGIEL